MAERLKAAVLKTAGRRRPAGSNPAPSASLGSLYGEVAEPAEGNRLLSGCTGKTVPRVRIPPSPPSSFYRVFREDRPYGEVSELAEGTRLEIA